ncbi:hypothetical protein OSTOST_09814, partial [Ostertagia ostertagi]
MEQLTKNIYGSCQESSGKAKLYLVYKLALTQRADYWDQDKIAVDEVEERHITCWWKTLPIRDVICELDVQLASSGMSSEPPNQRLTLLRTVQLREKELAFETSLVTLQEFPNGGGKLPIRIQMTQQDLVVEMQKTMGLCASKKRYTTELSSDEIEAIRDVWIKAKNNNVGKKILQTLIEKRPKFAEYFGIQSESLDIKALNQSKEFHLQ